MAGDGSILATIGDVDAPFLARSALKPLFAATLLSLGLSLERHELALACGSIVGRAEQVDVARAMAARLGVAEGDLRCPPRRSAWLKEATRFANVCIGKHIALAAAAKASAEPGSYTAPEHPVQRHLASGVAERTGVPVAATAVDGCGAPVFSTSVLGLAKAGSALAGGDAGGSASGSEMGRCGAAMRAHPELVDGAGAGDTVLMRELGVTAKFGAEGTQLLVAADGTSAVVKAEDGARRAATAAALALLEQSGAVGRGSTERVGEALGLVVLGGGAAVGRIRAAF